MAEKAESLLASMLAIKCPRCREGDMFPTGSFEFNEPFEMNKRCPNCNQNYYPEVGFYYGAMFISYIFTAFFSLGFVFFVHWVLEWSTFASFMALFVLMGIFFVYTFRFARSVWLHLNVSYDKDWEK